MPVRRLLISNGVRNPECLINNNEFQAVIHYVPDLTIFPPGSSIVLDFGEALHGGVRFNNYGPSGKLLFNFGESVSEAIGASNQDCSRKCAVLDLPHSGMLEYGNTVFRFVKIENVGEIEVKCLNVIAVALECDIEITGMFESSDEKLNQIWKTAVRTVHLCMQDYIYDGAKRDRIVWMGDMHPEIRGILCAFSDVSIIRNSLEFLIRQAPPEKPMNNIYTYSCWFIVSVWDYYLVSGDRDFLEKHAGYFNRMLETYTQFVAPDGSEIVPERRFLDWPNNNNLSAKHAGIQALVLMMMTAGKQILRELRLDYSFISEAEDRLRMHVPDPADRKAPAALMTLSGLADRRDVLENNPLLDVSTFYGYYILQAKPTVSALNLIRRFWGSMIDLGATSFWEDFDLSWVADASRIDEPPVPGKKDIHADFGDYCYKGLRHSLSHGWSCGPAPFLSEKILGVRFTAPGRVIIKPDMGGLEYVRGKVPTPHGIIEVAADASGKVEYALPYGIEEA